MKGSDQSDPYGWPPEMPEALSGQIPYSGKHVAPWPDCPDHHEVAHRDRQPPWCDACGWNRGHVVAPSRLGTPGQQQRGQQGTASEPPC